MTKEVENQLPDQNLIIFYADDDEDDRDTFKDVINDISENASLYTHSHGDNLLNAMKNPPPVPNLVFLDLNMPGKNGFEVLQEIRQSKDFGKTPVIIVSTSSDEKTISKSKNLGANYYIPKPNNYSTFKKSINHVLNIDWNTFNPQAEEFVYKNN